MQRSPLEAMISNERCRFILTERGGIPSWSFSSRTKQQVSGYRTKQARNSRLCPSRSKRGVWGIGLCQQYAREPPGGRMGMTIGDGQQHNPSDGVAAGQRADTYERCLAPRQSSRHDDDGFASSSFGESRTPWQIRDRRQICRLAQGVSRAIACRS